jgi:hypothetical protein
VIVEDGVVRVVDPPVIVHPVMSVEPTVTVTVVSVPTPITGELIVNDVPPVAPTGIVTPDGIVMLYTGPTDALLLIVWFAAVVSVVELLVKVQFGMIAVPTRNAIPDNVPTPSGVSFKVNELTDVPPVETASELLILKEYGIIGGWKVRVLEPFDTKDVTRLSVVVASVLSNHIVGDKSDGSNGFLYRRSAGVIGVTSTGGKL